MKGRRNREREALSVAEACQGPGWNGVREGEWGDQKNSLPFVCRVLGQVRLYKKKGERVGGAGGGQTDRNGEIQYHQRRTPISMEGVIISY